MSVTVSSRHRVTVPKDVRDGLGIRPVQKLNFIVLGGLMHVVPVLSLDQLRGRVLRDRGHRRHPPAQP